MRPRWPPFFKSAKTLSLIDPLFSFNSQWMTPFLYNSQAILPICHWKTPFFGKFCKKMNFVDKYVSQLYFSLEKLTKNLQFSSMIPYFFVFLTEWPPILDKWSLTERPMLWITGLLTGWPPSFWQHLCYFTVWPPIFWSCHWMTPSFWQMVSDPCFWIAGRTYPSLPNVSTPPPRGNVITQFFIAEVVKIRVKLPWWERYLRQILEYESSFTDIGWGAVFVCFWPDHVYKEAFNLQ